MALKLSELAEVVVAAVKSAVMPVGSAEVDSVTAALKPSMSTTVMAVVGLDGPFCRTLSEPAEEASVKLGDSTVSARGVELLSDP